MSKFQLILLVVFGAFILIAVMLFSMSSGGGSSVPTITIWGDISAPDFSNLMNVAGLQNNQTAKIRYVEKSSATFDTDFTEALASGVGPDLVIISQENLWKQKNRLLLIPATSINQNDFISTFIDEGSLFYTTGGAYALPLIVDPLVLYWNRDLFSKEAIATPPKYWDEIYDYATKLTEKDNAGNITTSAIALGGSTNIPNSKDILALLMLQAGTPITNIVSGNLRAELTNSFNLSVVPAQAAVDFYTQFSNPAKPFYSWNRSMKSAGTSFTSGDSAMYIGFASELFNLLAKNPTLNLGISAIPQSRVSNKAITFGRLSALAVVKNSRNPTAALNIALTLISKDVMSALSKIVSLPPTRRDLLTVKQTDLAQSVFYDAAIRSRGWLDPDEVKTTQIFSNIVESVTSGRARTSEALGAAQNQINALIK